MARNKVVPNDVHINHNENADSEFDVICKQLFSSDSQNGILISLASREDKQKLIEYALNESIWTHKHEYILSLMNVMKKLLECPQHVHNWMQHQTNVFKTVFHVLGSCQMQLNVPQMIPLFDDIEMSLYEYICYHVCSFTTILNGEEFHCLEHVLLQSLLSDQFVVSMMASDVWCFVARNSTPNVCSNHCSLLMKILTHCSLNSNVFTNVVSLINRILPLLDLNDTKLFIDAYDVIKYARIWKHIDLSRVLSKEWAQDVYKTLTETIERESCMQMDQLIIFAKVVPNDDTNGKNILFNIMAQVFLGYIQGNITLQVLESLIQCLPESVDDIFFKILHKFRDSIKDMGKDESHELVYYELINYFTSMQQKSLLNENKLIEMIATTVSAFFTKDCHYWIKYNTMMAIINFSLKSKTDTIENFIKTLSPYIKESFRFSLQHFNCNVNSIIGEEEQMEYIQNRIILKRKIPQSENFNAKKQKIGGNEMSEDHFHINNIIVEMKECIKKLKNKKQFIKKNDIKEELIKLYTEFGHFINDFK